MSQPPRTRAELTLGGEIAIKLFDPELSSRVDGRFRLMQEATTAARIVSPNVVRVLDHGFTIGGRGFIVMERLVGENLGARLLSLRPVTTDEVLSLLRGACAGLAAGHALGVLHRRVDPDNLFLHQTEGRVLVKLLNFGMTHDRGQAAGVRDRKGYSSEGSGDYSSPEQVEGGAIDARSDLYSLALVAYRCLAGCLPFKEGGEMGRTSIFARSQSIPRSVGNPALPRELGAWFDDMLQVDPNQRSCQTPAELVESFAAACAGPRVPPASEVKTTTTPRRTHSTSPFEARRPSTGRRPWVLKALAAACSLAAACAMFWRVLRQPETRSLDSRGTTTPAPASPPAIFLHLTVSPKEARVTLDGQPLPSNPFATVRPADTRSHLLRAEAPGYVPSEREVALARDLTLEFALSPVAGAADLVTPAAPALKGLTSPPARTTRAASARPSPALAAPSGSSEGANKLRPTHERHLMVDRSNPWPER